MANVVQFRRSTAILTLVAASVGGGLIAAFAVATHEKAPVVSVARADNSTRPDSSTVQRISSLSNSFADMIEKASPAVVKISSTRVIKASEQQGNGNNPFLSDPFFQRFFGGPNARPRDQRERGLGSGVIISNDGYILTNNHVIDKASSLKVELADGRTFTGKMIGTDPQTDIGVVKIAASNLPTLSYANSDSARVGDLCFAIGNPFGQDHSVTMGIVSAKGRKLEARAYIQNFIQTDAAINPGNSGGALINAKGELIGINTAILSGGSSFGGEGGNIGIGFAVPSNMAKQVADQLMKNGKVSRGYMGATLGPIPADAAPLLGLKDAKGAYIAEVAPGKPAAKAGLKQGDIVTAIDGKKVENYDELTADVISHSPGSTVSLDVIRDGKPMSVKITLGQRPSSTDFDSSNRRGDNDGSNNGDNDNSGGTTARGISVETLTPELAQQAGVTDNIHGVVVTDVDQSSPAADAGVGRGLVITSVNRHPVANAQDFKREMAQAGDKPVLLTINQGGTSALIVVQPK
ncbi:MAG: Do family serine endopeptidase [Acidobacteriaceae bacterium]|nr:Do family serine endopeptidase [Acidobacteriaceae bacterium]MBV9307992.1 Do family serine endopeptidase [Acidobacteriaceae bacterium]